MSVTRTAAQSWQPQKNLFPIPQSDDIPEEEWDIDPLNFVPFTKKDIETGQISYCQICGGCFLMDVDARKWITEKGTCPLCMKQVGADNIAAVPHDEWEPLYDTWKSNWLLDHSPVLPVQPPEQAGGPELEAASLYDQVERHLKAAVETFVLCNKHHDVCMRASYALNHGSDLVTASINRIGPLDTPMKRQLWRNNNNLLNQMMAETSFFLETYIRLPMFTPADPWTRPVWTQLPPAPTAIAYYNRAHALRAEFTTTLNLFNESIANNRNSLNFIARVLTSNQLDLQVTSTLQSVTYRAEYIFNGSTYHLEGTVSA